MPMIKRQFLRHIVNDPSSDGGEIAGARRVAATKPAVHRHPFKLWRRENRKRVLVSNKTTCMITFRDKMTKLGLQL